MRSSVSASTGDAPDAAATGVEGSQQVCRECRDFELRAHNAGLRDVDLWFPSRFLSQVVGRRGAS